MYDFYLGSKSEIIDNEEKYLLTIKRMLPRWLNSISDDLYIAIHRLLNKYCDKEKVVLAETGVGASSIVLLYHAMKNEGLLFSWDISNPKGSALRNIMNDTLSQLFNKTIWNNWKFIPSASLLPFLGIEIIEEFDKKVDFVFCDSEHTWKNLKGEISLFAKVVNEKAVYAIDDANINFKNYNASFINMFRKKNGLPPVTIPDNESQTFEKETYKLLNSLFENVEVLETSYQGTESFDILNSYFTYDQEDKNKIEMENLRNSGMRFCAWQVLNCKKVNLK